MKIRYLIMTTVLLVLIGSGLLLLFFKGERSPEEIRPPVTFPTSSQVPHTDGGLDGNTQSPTISLTVQNGEKMTVLDFLNDPNTKADSINLGYYNLNDPSSDAYLITYIAATQYFNIVLLKEPLGEVRERAELYLAKALGISNAELCRTIYTISTPSYVSAIYGGNNLGFSFCPGATALPQ